MGLLWVTTARTVPLVKVRWIHGVSDDTRAATVRDLSLEWRIPDESRTATYALLDSTPENIRRIVQHPLVEDTAFIDRSSYALSNAPTVRTWAGDRVLAGSWPRMLLYASLIGLFVGLASLPYRARDQSRHAAGRPIVFAVVWFAAFVVTVCSFVFHNDHFDRISRARQIARYGEWPFRDFFDPGYFMTEFVAAGLQLLLGDSLLGDVILSSVCIATGTVLVATLSLRVSQSLVTSLVASLLALSALPRAYDFDKVLFYPLAVALCWRYVDLPVMKRLWGVAAGVVVAALFRYDTGIYIAGAALVTLVAVHAGDWRVLWKRLGLLAAGVGCLSLPVLVLLQLTAGLPNVVDQVVTYAVREGAGTRIVTPPAIALNRASTFENANAVLFYLFHALPIAGIALLTLKGRFQLASRQELANVSSLVVLCIVLNLFILRSPVAARAGGMIGPAAILGAWMFHSAWQVRHRAARLLIRPASVAVLWLVVWSVSTAAVWEQHLTSERLRPSAFTAMLTAAAASPPDPDLIGTRDAAFVHYLRDCTRRDDRILVTYFAPEVAFFAQRGFAGGVAALHGAHWSEPRFQRRSVQSLTANPPVLVIQRSLDTDFRQIYPLLAGYISKHYRRVGTTASLAVGSSETFVLLARRDREPTATHGTSSLPCFR